MNTLSKRTLNIKDKDELKQEFKKTRDKYLKEVSELRKRYKESLVDLVLAYSAAD